MNKSVSAHRLQIELFDLTEKDRKIFEFIERSSLEGMWYWGLENPAQAGFG